MSPLNIRFPPCRVCALGTTGNLCMQSEERHSNKIRSTCEPTGSVTRASSTLGNPSFICTDTCVQRSMYENVPRKPIVSQQIVCNNLSAYQSGSSPVSHGQGKQRNTKQLLKWMRQLIREPLQEWSASRQLLVWNTFTPVRLCIHRLALAWCTLACCQWLSLERGTEWPGDRRVGESGHFLNSVPINKI